MKKRKYIVFIMAVIAVAFMSCEPSNSHSGDSCDHPAFAEPDEIMAAWTTKIRGHLDEMNEEQQRVTNHILREMQPEWWGVKCHEACEKQKVFDDVFTRHEISRYFNASPRELFNCPAARTGPDDDPHSHGQGQPQTPHCTCSQASDWCSPGQICDATSCHNPNHGKWGCGTLWTWECDARCRLQTGKIINHKKDQCTKYSSAWDSGKTHRTQGVHLLMSKRLNHPGEQGHTTWWSERG